MASFKTPIKRVKGLGSAKSGTSEFWHQRITSVALIPLTCWFVFSILRFIGEDRWLVITWLHVPMNALLMMLFVGVSYYHAYIGLKVVIEDYIHKEFSKIALIIISQLGLFAAAVATLFAILRIVFGG